MRLILRENASAIFSSICSSITNNILNGLTSAVRSKIKPMPHTTFLCVDYLRRIPDSADPILHFSIRFDGTFMPSSRKVSLRANNDETLPYAPDTLGKQESQSWQKSPRIVSIRLQTSVAPLAGASATARSCALSRPRTGAPSLVN